MPGLQLALLGPIQIDLDGRRLAGFPTAKALGLLLFLAAEAGQAHRREALAGMFWPDQPEDTARANLRKTLERLRRVLGEDAPPAARANRQPPYLLVDAQTVQFNPASDHALDVAQFADLLAACERHPHRRLENCQSCAQRLRQALDLYRGEFLAGFFLKDSIEFEEWSLLQRERLRRQAMDALAILAAHFETAGEYTAARPLVERQLELDPWREEAHQRLMRLLALGGQRSAALAQYVACRRVLQQELGVEPSAETTALFERLRDGIALEEPPNLVERRTRRQALPALPTPIVGRGTELAGLTELLSDPGRRLITIVGLGGTGKTHLALAAAHALAHDFAHGVVFVPLSGLRSSEYLAATILAALDVPLQGHLEASKVLLDCLRPREMLLCLDSLEHLLPAAVEPGENRAAPRELPSGPEQPHPAMTAPELLAAIVEHAPDVTLVVTSRERLALRAEWVFDLGGLPYPAETAAATPGPAQYASVQLFLERARQAGRPISAEAMEMQAVARICQAVEGLPLAIELAVASLRSRPAAALAEELDRGLAALATAHRDVPARHRSVRAAFEHSWRLLAPGEQRLFRRLAVFHGGFDGQAAAEVAQADPALLGSLADKSLLRAGSAGRYGLHDLLRQFAQEKLDAAGEDAAICRRHLAYYQAWMEQTESKLYGDEEPIWLPRVVWEHDNLRAALHWAVAHGDAEMGIRLAGSLWYFWYLRGHWREGRRWLERLLAPGRADAAGGDAAAQTARARAMDGLGVLAWRQGDYAYAAEVLNQALALMRRVGDTWGLSRALVHLGILYTDQGNLPGAQSVYEESLALSRSLGDRTRTATALHNLGNLATQQSDFERAAPLYEECLALYRELGDRAGIALLNLGLGSIARVRGDYPRAREILEESLALARDMGDDWTAANALHNLSLVASAQGKEADSAELTRASFELFEALGDAQTLAAALAELGQVCLDRGDLACAAERFRDSLERQHVLGNALGVAEALERIAEVARRSGAPAIAAHLLGAAAKLRESAPAPVPAHQQAAYAALTSALQAQLGEAEFHSQVAAGRVLSPEQVLQAARSIVPGGEPAAETGASVSP